MERAIMEDKSHENCPPKIVLLNTSLKLAEEWVSKMTECADDDVQDEPQGRPYRLGLGAIVPRQTKIGPLNDPLERKLYGQVDRQKKRAAVSALANSNKDKKGDDSDDSDDTESRTRAFDKKRGAANPKTTPVPTKKKKK